MVVLRSGVDALLHHQLEDGRVLNHVSKPGGGVGVCMARERRQDFRKFSCSWRYVVTMVHGMASGQQGLQTVFCMSGGRDGVCRNVSLH